jgi:hypothetical protein
MSLAAKDNRSDSVFLGHTNDVLLVTATIAPKSGVPNLSRVDPEKRLTDYIHGLKFYLSLLPKTFEHLVFCENSNSDVSKLRDVVCQQGLSDRVTFFVKDGLDYPPHFDRGYGEFKLIDDAMKTVKILQRRDVRIWKVTGRYVVKNIATIVGKTNHLFDVACNYRNRPKHWVDTYLIGWTAYAYNAYLMGVYDKLKTNVPGVPLGIAAEELLRLHLESIPDIRIIRRFLATPDIRGVRGADNRQYQDRLNFKYLLRSSLRLVAPWFWI